MAFGITAQGFKAKRLADIQLETDAAWRGKFGAGFDLDSRTPEGQIRDTLDEREASIWELAEAVSRAYVPVFAEDAQLDNVLALTGLTRKLATFSKVDSGRARGVFGTVVPAGTIVSVENDEAALFTTDDPATISITAVNEVQKLSFSVTPVSGNFKIVFDGEITAVIAWNASAAAVQAALEALVNIGPGNALVTGAITSATGLTITFQAAMGGLPQPQVSTTENNLLALSVITPTTLTQGEKAKSPFVNLTATVTGPVAAPTGSLIVIETPVVGLQEFINEEDAILGRNIENDQDAKLRREQELTKAGSCTVEAIKADMLDINDVTAAVVFQNNLSITDFEGRPPKSIDVVVQGGLNAEIGQALFLTIAAGVTQTVGDILINVIDSQGFTQPIRFSRPQEVAIWIEVDVTKDPALFPIDGAAQIKAKILTWGLKRTIGQDVIVFGTDPLSCSFDDVPGMLDLVFRIGIAPAPVGDANVAITARQIAMFDTARITVAVA